MHVFVFCIIRGPSGVLSEETLAALYTANGIYYKILHFTFEYAKLPSRIFSARMVTADVNKNSLWLFCKILPIALYINS